jgi:Tol biopolymer transport system component
MTLEPARQVERQDLEVVRTEFNESQAQFSPDGRWIAYQSDKTGRSEIYLRPFPGTGDDVPASIEGGTQPRWNPSSPELFYMAVSIRVASGSGKIEPGAPHALFRTDVGSTATQAYRQQYVVSPDGQSFIMNSAVREGSASPITVILNWRPPTR